VIRGRGQLAVFLRFVLVNALNTGLYWGLYLVLLLVTPYLVANAVALVIAVLVAYVANARYAFGVSASRSSLVKYIVVNGTTTLLRMGVVWLLVEPLSLDQHLAPPAAVAITTPIAYLMTRWAMAASTATRPAGTDDQSSSRETAASRLSPAIEVSQVDQPGRRRTASSAARAPARSPRREAANAAYSSRAPSGAKTARVS
jgi:putative flippase GtrA